MKSLHVDTNNNLHQVICHFIIKHVKPTDKSHVEQYRPTRLSFIK